LCRVVNQRSVEPSAVSPVEVAITFVSSPEARSPRSVMVTWVWAAPLLVTTFSQRRNVLLLGTNTLRVSVMFAFCAEKAWDAKTSSWFLPFESAQVGVAGWPGLKTRGTASFVPFTAVDRSALEASRAGVRGAWAR